MALVSTYCMDQITIFHMFALSPLGMCVQWEILLGVGGGGRRS